MSRIKTGVTAHKRHKRVLEQAKGYYGARSKNYRVAARAVLKAGLYSYRDRKTRKRDFRALWIIRINAAARDLGMNYSTFMHQLKIQNVDLNRKMLAELAIYNPEAFESIVSSCHAQ